MKKKVLSMLLALSLCLGILPAQALAEEELPLETPSVEEALPTEEAPPAEETPPAEEVPPVEEERPAGEEFSVEDAAQEEDEPPAEDVPTEAVLLEGTAASGTHGKDLTWTLDEAGTLTISGTGDMPNSFAPWSTHRASVKTVIVGAGVTTIGSNAFSGCNNLTSVTIPSGVTLIGNGAFSGCGSLTSVTLPTGVISIGSSAFSNSGLTSVAIPSGVEDIGSSAFSGCSSLTSVTIPMGMTTIGNSAFSGCSSLTSVTIPDSVDVIGISAFSNSGLTSVVIPSGVKGINNNVFSGCSSLTSVTIPSSVTDISDHAFSGCGSLTSVTIPNSVISIGERAFENSGLISVTIPNSVTSIGSSAFKNSGLTSVTLPSSMTTTGYSIFHNCSALTSVTIPSSVNVIEGYAFSGCSSLTDVTIPDSVKSIGYDAFSGCSSLTEVTIPSSVETIDRNAFNGCSSLTRVTLPENIKDISDGVFQDCPRLTEVNIPDKVISIDSNSFKGCSGLTALTIPDGVTSIGIGAFSGCSGLTKMTLPEGVIYINNEVFNGCSSLTEVTLLGRVLSIGHKAFLGCSSLTGLTIPDSVTFIGSGAFSGCSGLTKMTLPEGVIYINDEVFNGCSSLITVTIPGSVESIGGNAFSGCSSLTGVMIPDGVTYIGREAFSGCSSLTEVTIPDGVPSIGVGTFRDCSSLTTVTLPSSLKSIGSETFHGCSSLTEVTLPGSVETIDNKAFSGCSSLTGLTIPGSVTYIGYEAFRDCSKLTEMTIPSTATSIGNALFRGCSGLTEVTIRGKMTSIGFEMFYGCSALSSVTLPDSVTRIDRRAFESCTKLTDIYYAGTLEQWNTLLKRFTPSVNVRVHLIETGEILFTVILDPHGGQLDSKSIAAIAGKPYGALPVPTWNEHIFKGWFTGIEDGEQVTAETLFSEEDAGRTLYARWSPDWLEKMTYRFSNSYDGFGYNNPYRIPYERYACVFGDTPRAKTIYESEREWYGNCFGMSTTSAMFSQNGISTEMFRSGAKRPYDLEVLDKNGTWNLTLRQFIESMQISQFSERLAKRGGLNDVCAQAKVFQQSEKAPPVVCVWGSMENHKVGGHAMLVYDLIDVSATESHLMVYDPNFPNDKGRFIKIDCSNGVYTGWHYFMNGVYNWGTGDPNARIAYVPYSDFYGLWTEKPVSYSLSDRAAASASANEKSALLIFNSDNAAILDAEGNRIAVVENGQLDTERTDIFPMLSVGVLPDGTVPSRENTILFLPPDQYTLERGNNSDQPLDAVMVHVGQSAAVTTSGNSVTFAVDDSCGLNYAKANGSEAGEYTITLESSLLERPEASPGTFYTVTASGSLDEKGASAAQVAGELFAENVPADNVQVNGNPVSTEDLGDGGALDISTVLHPNITATLQEDGSVVLSSSPAGVVHVYAASYNSDGRMTELTTGILKPEDSTIQFEKPVTEGARIFLLNEKSAPVSRSIVIERQA